MPFNGRDVRRSLKKKGFVEENKGHVFLYHSIDGKRTGLYTYVSHGKDKEDVGHDNVRSMKDQLGLLSNKQVYDLVECPMTEKGYIQVLTDTGKLPK